MDAKRKRKVIWAGLVAAALLVCLGAVVLNEPPYAFLNKFHPQRVVARADELFSPGSSRAVSKWQGKITMLVFTASDAPLVIAALHNELTKNQGYAVEGYLDGVEDARWIAWRFLRGSPGKSADEMVVYYPPESAADHPAIFEYGLKHRGLAEGQGKKVCVVVILRMDTWIERWLAKLKLFLHLD